MPLRLLAVSGGTLLFLVGGLSLTLFMAAVLGGAPPSTLWIFMGLTVVLHLVGWLLSPWLMDLIQTWAYHFEKLAFLDFERRYPVVAAFTRQVCEHEGLPLPAMRIVYDDNPTAYTYGSLPSNARVAISTGLFKYLDDDEVCAVVAHELGHVRHYDFAVMTLASLLLQLLYEAFWILTRGRGGDGERNHAFWVAGLVAYALWFVGTYVVLWLSRTREYMADRFAAVGMGDAIPLQRALVKIAYGLADMQQAAEASGEGGDQRLIQATRAMGIADPKVASSLGHAMRAGGASSPAAGAFQADVSAAGRSAFRPDLVAPVFLFDLYNPWASVVELASTHPLTGKRLKELEDLNGQMRMPGLFGFDEIDRQGKALDQDRLYGSFAVEVLIYALPFILPLFALVLAVLHPEVGLGLLLTSVGLGLLVRGLYRYGMLGAHERTTVYELMCDPYASPLRGRPVILEGQLVGKGNAGSKVSEDFMMRDRSGALMYLNFHHAAGWLGNLFFGYFSGERMIGREAVATGWFRRGVSQHVDLKALQVAGQRYASWTRFYGVFWGALLTTLGIGLTLLLGLTPLGAFLSGLVA